MKISGYANIYWEPPARKIVHGIFSFEYSIFLYSMHLAADEEAEKSLQVNRDRRLLGKAIPMEIEVPEKEIL